MPDPSPEYPHLKRWDRDNVAYLYLREIKEGEAVRQIPVSFVSRPDSPDLIIDLSVDGEVLGVEFLNAKQQLADASLYTHLVQVSE